MRITLNSNRASFEAFEQRVEDAALNRYLDSLSVQEQEDDEDFEALLDYEAGLRNPEVSA